jgi:hypothetical protein
VTISSRLIAFGSAKKSRMSLAKARDFGRQFLLVYGASGRDIDEDDPKLLNRQ